MAPFEFIKHHLQPLARGPWAQPTPTSTPTPTITVPSIISRQAPPTVTIFVNRTNCSSHLSGGAIAGIVIGSVIAFILLVWLLWACFYLGTSPREREREVVYHDIEPSHHRHHHHHHHRRRRRSRSSDTSLPAPVPPVVPPPVPPPVIIRETSQRPTTYIYKNEEREEFKGGERVHRGRRSSRYE